MPLNKIKGRVSAFEIGGWLEKGFPVVSRAAGRWGKVISVETNCIDAVVVKTRSFLGITTFSSGDDVYAEEESGVVFIRNLLELSDAQIP